MSDNQLTHKLENTSNNKKTKTLSIALFASFLWSLLFSIFLTLVLTIPLINMIPFLLGYPLHYIWPELGHTGGLVEYGFLWIIIKQDWLYAVYFLYFLTVPFLPSCIVILLAYKFRKNKISST